MAQKKRKAFAKAICLMLALGVCLPGLAQNNVYAETAAADNSAADEPGNCYGYYALKLMGDEAVLEAYLDLWELVGSYDGSVSSEELVFEEPLTESQFTSAWMAFRGDAPQYFWYSPEFPQLTESDAEDGTYVAASIAYSYNSQESLEAARAEFDAAAEAFLADAEIDTEENEISRECMLYQKLGKYLTIQYMDDMETQTYLAVVERQADSLGVSNALAYFLQRCGIMAHVVNGSYKSDNDVFLNHSWVLVRLEGKFYWCDLSWDADGETLREYYNDKADIIFTKDHIFPTDYPLPRCTESLSG